MKVELDIDEVTMDELIKQILKDHYKSLKFEPLAVPMWTYDVEEEKRMWKKLRKSFKIVLSWYDENKYGTTEELLK